MSACSQARHLSPKQYLWRIIIKDHDVPFSVIYIFSLEKKHIIKLFFSENTQAEWQMLFSLLRHTLLCLQFLLLSQVCRRTAYPTIVLYQLVFLSLVMLLQALVLHQPTCPSSSMLPLVTIGKCTLKEMHSAREALRKNVSNRKGEKEAIIQPAGDI